MSTKTGVGADSIGNIEEFLQHVWRRSLTTTTRALAGPAFCPPLCGPDCWSSLISEQGLWRFPVDQAVYKRLHDAGPEPFERALQADQQRVGAGFGI